MAAAPVSTGLDSSFTNSHHCKFLLPLASPARTPTKRFPVFCNSTKSQQNLGETHQKDRKTQKTPKTPSLSDQLRPLSAVLLSEPTKGSFSKKPKSIWVNPAKPRRSVLSLQRHKRSPHSQNPQFRDLRLFAGQLNECELSKDAVDAVLEEIPRPLNKENALLIIKSLRSWQKAHLFLNWVKAQNCFSLEPIFYNVTMKALRYEKQFQLVEELANEMIADGIELDNITYSTIISCAKKCNLFDKAVEWFERMYKTGLMPDEVTYSSVLDVYAKLGKVEEVMSLYDRARAAGWKPDPIAFSVMGKLFGEARDCDGIQFVLKEMKSLELSPNLNLYNTLLEALGKAGKPGLARGLFQEMIDSGTYPDARTLTALIRMYGRARWAQDALNLWEEMKANRWPMDKILCNTLLNMCAEIGLEEEAEELFEEMRRSEGSRPDSWSYTAMFNLYGIKGNVEKAMLLFVGMSDLGVNLDIMGCTCLIQCLGKANRIDDLVKVYTMCIERGMKPDDKLCGCLLSVVASCNEVDNADKVLACLQQANPKLAAFIRLLEEEKTSSATIKEDFKDILGIATVQTRRPFCNCLIDICRKRDLHERALELLYLGRLYGLYPDLYNKTAEEWCLNVQFLSIGAAFTAFEEWIGILSRLMKKQETLPATFSARTGAGRNKLMASALSSHINQLSAPFRQNEANSSYFVATQEDLVPWLQSRIASPTIPSLAL